MKSNVKRGESALVLGVAAALIAICVVALGSFLTNASAAETEGVGSAPMEAGMPVNDEVQAPEGFTVKVDTRGIDLPEGSVSAQYAVAATAEIAERAYAQKPTGRALAVLYNSETTMSASYDIIHGLFWNVLVETEGGSVSADIVAADGNDFSSDLSPFSADGWAKEFDAWDDQNVDGKSNFGTEAELIESRKEHPEPEPLMDDSQQNEARQRKIDAMMEFASGLADEPHGAKAVEIVNERNLGNGASAVSGRILTSGGGGPIDQMPLSTYLIEVALDDGSYLFVQLGKDDMALYDCERSPVDLPTRWYG